MTRVEDLMTENVKSVKPETPLAEAAMMLQQYAFNGLPVVDKTGKLVGLFTERNMVSDQSYVHVKTLLKLFSKLEFYKQDNSAIRNELKDIIKLQVKDLMESAPTTIKSSESIERAAQLFADPKNNPLPVVDAKQKLIGILTLSDMMKLYGVPTRHLLNQKDIDKQVDEFVQKFEKNFLVVSRFRVSTWFLVSISFAFLGFAIAMFLILRISV